MTIRQLRGIIERLDGDMLVVVPDGEYSSRYHGVGNAVIQFSENFAPIFALIPNDKVRIEYVNENGAVNKPEDRW